MVTNESWRPTGDKAWSNFVFGIDNLNPRSSGTDIWKYVDDVLTSEGLAKNSNSNMQSNLDSICSWSLQNYMKNNVKKCKELRILLPLLIDEQALEIVQSHKVLGLIIQNNLKYGTNTLIQSFAKHLNGCTLSSLYAEVASLLKIYLRSISRSYAQC